MQVKFSERVYLWASIIIFLLFLLALVGFASPAWRAGDYGARQNVESGLIIRCHHDLRVSYHRCAPFTLGSQPPWFEVSRVFCALSVVLLLTLVVASIYLHVSDKKKNDYMYPLVGAIFTALLGMTGAIVFASMSTALLEQYRANLSWGWSLFIVSHILLFITAVVFIIIMRTARRKPKPRLVAPTREIIF